MTTTPDELYGALEDFVMRLMNLAESDGMDALVDLDLSFSQARTLFLLAKTAEPMSIHAIATQLGLSDAAAGRNVEQLLKLDVVERRESPEDRRVKLVSLTPVGEKLAVSHVDAKRDSIKAFTAALPPEQRDDLHRVLSDVLASGTLRPRKNQEHCL
ncbi:MarR family winged helix-turn-helix transcriptional regulator [Aeromicrobium chenweiae]|uniref:MarR family transcriptional regulator n=1 Tax=Aeromicrobium chenweiae TaxID=2079793 RepID=A0A2S0WIU9_9ACTN|nr:MarR family transcriptional regulator [Aeromicrobium chenweiae]AWB91227.1 MarR family transcriptional regulator [Aeromicrobium chenweiae]TGN31745.1 MarR family transcriptional regulator [Aeromicrobium chenweiae]